jgi:hypothetical protein
MFPLCLEALGINLKFLLMFTVCDTVLATYSMDKSVACGHKWNSTVDSIYSDALFCLVYHLYWHYNNGPRWNAWYKTSKQVFLTNDT